MLDPGDPFLRAVGISDDQGRVKPGRRDKYRQVEEFLRALEPVLDRARGGGPAGPMRVVDLGCGNAYLTFAAYRFLTDLTVSTCTLIGVDVKGAARQRNTVWRSRWDGATRSASWRARSPTSTWTDAATSYSRCTHATPQPTTRWPGRCAGRCRSYWPRRAVTTTCSASSDRVAAPQPYGPLTRYGILRERFADVLTDAVRAALLRILGYRVEVVEFVESRHTPRNTLLRAVRTGSPAAAQQLSEYVALTSDWGVRPALGERLAAEVEAAVGRHPMPARTP